MKKFVNLPEILVGIFIVLLLYITLVRKTAFLQEHLFFNFIMILPMLTFYGVFKMLQQFLKGTKMEKVATFGLSLGVLLFDLLLILTFFIL